MKANRQPHFLMESRMREIRTSGLTRGEPALRVPLLYWLINTASGYCSGKICVHSFDEPASPISCGNYLYASLQGVVKNW